MNARSLPTVFGLLLTMVLHAGFAMAYMSYRDSSTLRSPSRMKPSSHAEDDHLLLCEGRRCPQLPIKAKRRDIELPPPLAPDVLDAAIISALGNVEPDPNELPEIQAYEQPEIVEEAVNLSEPPKKEKPLVKKPEKSPEKKDPTSKKTLEELISDEAPDPRANIRKLQDIIGTKDGDASGSGTTAQKGSAYSAKAQKEIQKAFKKPPFVSASELKTLKVRVKITQMGLDGSVVRYSIISKSGNASYDDAALAAIQQFSTKDGGTRRLPIPDPEILRFINSEGLMITLDGRFARP